LKYQLSFPFLFSILLILILFEGCISTKKVTKEPEQGATKETNTEQEPERPVIELKGQPPAPKFTDIPKTPREFRGVWVATVNNIDWPSEAGLSVAKQKEELITILDRAEALNLNAVILQVRPAADAFYLSQYEPWSEYLNGKQGEAPDPYYDPLAFAVKEAHRRGLQLHAWFNPFRASHPSEDGPLAMGHIKNKQPKMVLEYGNYLWLDPGLPAARQYSIDVITDVVRRYNIDGVHLDDYFYPYPARDGQGNPIPFPDSVSYGRQLKLEGAPDINEWRRQNVDSFVQELHKQIKQIDPHCIFGISPFGIWRPGYPEGIHGFDAYERLFADSRKWLRKGWVDYLAPQLYWPIEKDGQSFPILLKWWSQQNSKDRHIWPGLFASKFYMTQEEGASKFEIGNQQQIIRQNKGISGSIHFSMNAFMAENASDGMLAELYEHKALVPKSPWMTDAQTKLSKPKITLNQGTKNYRLKFPHNNKVRWWVVKLRYGQQWQIKIYPSSKDKINIEKQNAQGPFIGLSVSGVDEMGRESKARQFRLSGKSYVNNEELSSKMANQ